MADSVKEEVFAVTKAFVDHYNETDFNGMLQCFTEDTVWFPPNSNPTVGRTDCILVATGFYSAGQITGTFVSTNMFFERLGEDYATAMDFCDGHDAAGETISYFKHWYLFKKVKGKWFIHRMAYSPRTKPTAAK